MLPMDAAPRKVKGFSLEARVIEPFAILLERPVSSPTRAVSAIVVRPSQLAENGADGNTRRDAGAALSATGLGARRPARSIGGRRRRSPRISTPCERGAQTEGRR